MDRIEKFLKKLSSKERARILPVLKKIKAGNIANLDIKKVKEKQHIFRVRVGDIRIVCVNDGADIHVVFIGRRNKGTYKSI